MKIRQLLLIIICLLCSSTLLARGLVVSGISGDVLKNVQQRLKLLEKQDDLSPFERTKLIIKNIKGAMAPFGYYSPNISVYGNRITVRLGEPVKINQIQLVINGPGKDIFSKIPKKLPIAVGDIFVSEKYEEAKQQLFDIAEQHGYLNAKVVFSKAIVNPAQHQAIILITFETGKQFYFGKIKFTNKTIYSHQFLRRFLNFHSGMPYSTKALMKLNENLSSTGYFNNVAVKPKISQSTNVPIKIHLKDKPRQNYTLGLGMGTDTGMRGRAGWQWRPVNARGHTFKALFQGSQRQNALQAQYVIPGNDPVTEQYTLTANIFQLSYPVGRANAKMLSAAKLYHQDNAQYTLSLNYLKEKYNFTDVAGQTASVLYPLMSYEFKKVQAPLFSKQGYAFTAQAIGGHDSGGSDLSFAQLSVGARAAIWLPTHTRLFLRTEFATTQTDDIYNLPLSLQTLAGGSDSIRGYHFNSIGPGKVLAVGSAEVQQEFKENWYVTAFYDIGDVFKPTKKHWRRGIGGGLMWVSPVGPLRISIAKALDQEKQPFRIIFNMGPDL